MRWVELSHGEVALRAGPPLPLEAGQARIAVRACGICATDLHLLHGMVLPPGARYPVRPGHEVAGVVTEVHNSLGGDEVHIGDAVTLHPLTTCRECAACSSGAEQLCARARVLGIHAGGGMADEVIWPTSRLVGIGELPFDQAALLPDAVATAWHALQRAALPRGGRLIVFGAGGVGTQVLRLARMVDQSLVLAAVVGTHASAERLAEERLAAVVVGLDGAGRRLRDALGGADAVIDFTGVAQAAGEALRSLHPGGTLVLGSVIDEPLALNTTTTGVVTREVNVLGSYASSIEDLRTVTSLAQTGQLELQSSISTTFPLEEAQRAFAVLDQKPAGLVRAQLIP